jgi:hypothetical protein
MKAKPPAKKSPARKPSGKRMTAPKSGVKVRMYRTGLGDCFLLAFPKDGNPDDPLYLMIDCGVYAGTPEPDNRTRIRRIVEDVRDATGGRLDVLVITHEHWDHVSAFHPSQAREIFEKEIELGTLWMAWTENLRIPLARDLHQGRKAARNALRQALVHMQGLKAGGGSADLVGKVLDFFGGDSDMGTSEGFGLLGAKKSVKTEEAMEWLRESYGQGRTRFLRPGEEPLTLEGVKDARVYVLGPPEDPDLIKRVNPTGDEVYPKAMAAAMEASFFAACGAMPGLALSEQGEAGEALRVSLPFDDMYRIANERAPEADPLFKRYLDEEAWRRIEGDWLEAAGEFALQLDNATNNTSLAFALEIGPPGRGKVLLFPGDAQVGNWRSWFGKVTLGKRELGRDMAWNVGRREVTAEDLLRRTVLYKVGHHGSHNATLREQGLELMGRTDGTGELVAFLPVDEHVARERAHYGEMPLRSLVKDLLIRTGGRVVRNDDGAQPKDAKSTLAPIDGAPPARPAADFLDKATDLYFEHTVK